jgi:hypothetical protein
VTKAAASALERGDEGPLSSTRPAPRVLILGTPEHEGRLCGRALDLLGADVQFALDGLPHAAHLDDPPDVLLVSREWSRGTRVAVARARRRGVPVVYLMDGIIEWSYVWNNLSYVRPEGTVLQPLLASHICTIGRRPARILAGMGLADRIHIVGMPRLDGVDRRRMFDPAKTATVVITTARTPAHNVEQKVYVRRALRDLKRWFDAHASARAAWRIAPELAAELNVPLDDSPSLLDSLRDASGLVSFASTTLVEGMLMGVPTALVDYRTVPQYVQTAWEIRSSDHIDTTLHDLLHPRQERLAFQDWCLREEMEPGDASLRLADVLRRAIAGEAPTAPPGTATTSHHDFGRLDYRQVHSELSAFAVAPMSVLQYELDATSNLLDFAMPDIVHLRSEVTRLQSEVTRLQTDLEIERGEAQRGRLAYDRQRDVLHSEIGFRRDAEAALAAAAETNTRTVQLFDHFKRRVFIDRLEPVVRTLKARRLKRVTVYGAGDVGRALIALLRERRIAVHRLADRDQALWGTTIDGITVGPIAACMDDRAPVIVLASFSHASAMRRTVMQELRGKRDLRIVAPKHWNLA